MKKLIAVILFITCFFAMASAEDFSSMSSDDLLSLIRSARNALQAKQAVEEGKVFLLDTEDVQIYLSGNSEESASNQWSGDNLTTNKYLDLEVIVINNTGKQLMICADTFIVNGWQVYVGAFCEAKGKAKVKDKISFIKSDADISSLSDIETIDCVFTAFDSNTYDNFELKNASVSVIYDGEKFIRVE